MSNGKYQSRKSNKALLVLLALVLVIGCTVGGTLAWLTAKTETVTNTFTVGDIGTLTLEEATGTVIEDGKKSYTIVPGMDIAKDPKVSYDLRYPDNYQYGLQPVSPYPDRCRQSEKVKLLCFQRYADGVWHF